MKLSIFAEDQNLKESGAPIYPSDIYEGCFYVPRVGGFKYQKQIQELIKHLYGTYYDPKDVDYNHVNAMWLGEYVTNWEGVIDESNGQELTFSRVDCRAIFNHEAHRESLVPLLIDKASRYENYLQEEGREAMEELKKR